MTEKVYLDKPYLKELYGRIVDKTYRDNKYYIITDKTIFHPHLIGGQPRDKGTINGIELIDIYQDKGRVVHVIDENISSDTVMMKLDWSYRLDFMQQHSGQHLLSSSFYRLFNSKTIDFFIGEEKSYIDIDLKNISYDDIYKVEDFANRIVFSNFNIESYTVKNQTSPKATDSNIRIVEIDGIDFSPCDGCHLKNTGEIGLIKVINYKNMEKFTRIEFLCGYRALYDYRKRVEEPFNHKQEIESKIKESEDKIEGLKKEILMLKLSNLIDTGYEYEDKTFILKDFPMEEYRESNALLEQLSSLDNNVGLFLFKDQMRLRLSLAISQNLNIDLAEILESLPESTRENLDLKNNRIYGYCSESQKNTLVNQIFNSIQKKL